MLVLVGASASGKTQLAKALIKHHQFKKLVTTTTRQPRKNERPGIDYHFLSAATFLKYQQENKLLEATHYHGHWYGIKKEDVQDDCVVIVDPQGANVLKAQLGHEAFIVFVKTSEGLRERRMLKRGDLAKEVAERLEIDQEHFAPEAFDAIDYTLDNNHGSILKNAQHLASVYALNQKAHSTEEENRH